MKINKKITYLGSFFYWFGIFLKRINCIIFLVIVIYCCLRKYFCNYKLDNFLWIAFAAILPAPIASMTVAEPVTISPPA